MSKGVWSAIAAYGAWGLFPIYWKLLAHIPALQLLSHRIIWSCVLLALIILVTRDTRAFLAEISRPRVFSIYLGAALLVGLNWFVYVWAVNAGHVVETSLGYFINPLFSVVFGVAFLGERLRPWQWAAVGLAAAGVAFLTVTHGSLPWIALTLAITFALYGLVKKTAPLSSVHGLALETAILLLPAAVFLGFETAQGRGGFPTGDASDLLVVGAGVATTVPLLLFSTAAKRIPLYWIGLFQYIAPTIQFMLGVFVYREALTIERLLGFSIVWAALAVFIVEGLITHRPWIMPVNVE